MIVRRMVARIGKNAVGAVAVQAVVRAGGLVRDVAVARLLGLGAVVNLYLFALTLQSILLGFAASLISVLLVPGFSRGEIRLTARVRFGALCVSGVGCAVGIAVVLGTNSDVWLVVAMLCTLASASSSAMFSARLIADHRQVAAVLPSMVIAVVPLVAAWIKTDRLTAADLVAANLVAYLAESILLGALCRQYARETAHLGARPPMRTVASVAGTAAISVAWLAVDVSVVRALGASAVSVYALASRIPIGLAGVLAPAVSNVLFASASLVVRDSRGLAENWVLIKNQMLRVGLLGLAVSLVVIAFTYPIQSWAFAGSRVDREAADQMYRVHSILCLMIPVFLAGMVAVRYFQAAGLHGLVNRVGLVSIATNVFADVLLARVFDVEGVAAATVLAYLVSLMMLLWHGQAVGRREGTM